MRSFRCACGAQVFFDNTACLTCGRELGFVPEASELFVLSEGADGVTETPSGRYRKCLNYAAQGVCNWLVGADGASELCQACELNSVIPDLSKPENRAHWLEVEKAKRRLIFSLNRLGLPVVPKRQDAERGLAFDIKADDGDERVLTGHSDGLITLNLDEADAAEREKMRLAMKERYRTLLGHFRHEVGHYFWDRLVRDEGKLEAFRALFGDEQLDYAQALKAHYAKQPDPDYAGQFISHYAASHPWEDFAETFAHYLHLVDTLETAEHYGFASVEDAPRHENFEALMDEWYRLSVALNALNRSMGLPDAYPFAISPIVKGKLGFVHQLIQGAKAAALAPALAATG